MLPEEKTDAKILLGVLVSVAMIGTGALTGRSWLSVLGALVMGSMFWAAVLTR